MKHELKKLRKKLSHERGATLIEYQAIAAVAVFICINSVAFVKQQAELAYLTAGSAMVGAEMPQFILDGTKKDYGTGGPDGVGSASHGGGTGESVETGEQAAHSGDPGGADGKDGSDPGSLTDPGKSSPPSSGSGPGNGNTMF